MTIERGEVEGVNSWAQFHPWWLSVYSTDSNQDLSLSKEVVVVVGWEKEKTPR